MEDSLLQLPQVHSGLDLYKNGFYLRHEHNFYLVFAFVFSAPCLFMTCSQQQI